MDRRDDALMGVDRMPCGEGWNPQFRVWRSSTATVNCCWSGGSSRPLYTNEFFGLVEYEEGPPAPEVGRDFCYGPWNDLPPQIKIYFRRGDTKRGDCGWIDLRKHGGHTGYSILNYALGTVTIDGRKCKVFEIQRYRSYVYNGDGQRTGGWLDPGTRIATDSDMLGRSYPFLWYVRYYYNTTVGRWYPVIPGSPGGWIETGLEIDTRYRSDLSIGGSTPKTIWIKTSLA